MYLICALCQTQGYFTSIMLAVIMISGNTGKHKNPYTLNIWIMLIQNSNT